MERIDRIEQNGTDRAGANQVEGLVRDNRVEVRVLFGASQKAPLRRGFRRSRPTLSRGGQHSVTTPLATGEQPVFPSVPHHWEAAMSVHYERNRDRWVVRWRESGRQRSRTCATEAEAQELDWTLNPPDASRDVVEEARFNDPRPSPGDQSGVYAYATSAGTRWRFVYRQSDGRLTTRRGFTSRSAALTARGIALEEVRRGEIRATPDTFGEFWKKLLEAKRPYITPGTLQDYATHGRKRLLPWFGELRLVTVSYSNPCRIGSAASAAPRDSSSS
ncbi:hypothetical protein OM076_13765 [Solirubrobacter ginsenosidimutans]|uniref:Uncharacterized protein n=1 Tax=Solirubrobacter ginsenosidimutans TaxID=490573 RepID=A0A9X3RZV6_9ACTN|nr:hypothetical protein [Solirubrobacter ginsenosidimutans]MDA0161340.1 hypothetical protein [Solirubrobacter ginsenosidimutans]